MADDELVAGDGEADREPVDRAVAVAVIAGLDGDVATQRAALDLAQGLDALAQERFDRGGGRHVAEVDVDGDSHDGDVCAPRGSR
ncbi:MAG: hypothetical protein M3Y87_26210 [Myxococcota bacterium]|nr:hypothetical protein [Myxococcota bacterium]